MPKTATITSDSYNELQVAYDYFNKALFENALPDCLISLQRKKRTYGYFSPNRYTHASGKKLIDEIAMNPEFFAIRSIKVTLSTLVHEMVHQWQQHHGKPSRRGYHNRQWAEKMMAIGLMPSDTGEEGGKIVGDKVSHYILEDKSFDRSCDKLLTKKFTLSWFDRFPAYQPKEIDPKLKHVLLFPKPSENRSNRTKYRCIHCEMQLWGKPNLRVLCGNEECDAFPLVAIK